MESNIGIWLDRIQQEMPLLRMGQIIDNAISRYNQTNTSKIPLFYIDDETLERALKEYYYQAKGSYVNAPTG